MKRLQGPRRWKRKRRLPGKRHPAVLALETLEQRLPLAVPTISVSVTDGDASEPDGLGVFEFLRTGGDGSAVTVSYAIGGTAENGVDYAGLGGQVTIPAGTDFVMLPPEQLREGIQPVYFHEADFDHDGHLDLAVASHQAVPGTLSIHLGDGTGDFADPIYYRTAGNGPRSLEVADFDEDGELDIAAANHNSSDVALFFGHGDGTFDEATLTPNVDSNPRMIKAADFDSDGHLDLVTANYGGQDITLLWGDGAGNFGNRTDIPTAHPDRLSTPRSMVVEDLNHDGRPDIAVSSSHDTNVSILLGDGNGGFAPLRTISWGPGNNYSLNITSNDLNRDGHIDLVTANYFGSSVSVLLGDGTGNFSNPQHIDLGDGIFEPRTVTTGDFNTDGIPDLAVADGKEVRVGVLLGDGDGNFGPKQDYLILPLGTLEILWNASVLARDFDEDGRDDIVAVRDLDSFVVLRNQTQPGGVASSWATVAVSVVDDTQPEPSESVVLTVIDGAAYDVGSPSSATLQVQDNDGTSPPGVGLLARWALDETSGTTAADHSGNGFDATVMGEPIWTAGNIAGGLELDGVNDYVDAGKGPSIVGSGGFTVASWVRTSGSSDQVIIQQRSPQAYNGQYQMLVKPNGVVSFWTFGDSAYGPTVTSTGAINDGQWHHVIGVREDDGTMRIYIDGLLDGSQSGPLRSLAEIGVYLGADRRSNARYLRGMLDDTRIYNRALDSQEAAALASSLLGPVAVDDAYQVSEDQSLSVAAPGLLTNDLGEDVTVTSISGTSELGVTVVGQADGAFQYRSAGVFEHLADGTTTSDAFVYTITDDGWEEPLSDSATVAITIMGVNDPPTAVADVAPATEDAAINIDVLANDIDVDAADVLSVTGIDDSATTGVVTIDPDGTVRYDPDGRFEYLSIGQTAADSFSYTIGDRYGADASADVSVVISGSNDAPTASDDFASTSERRAITLDVLLGDADPDAGDVITVVGLDDSATLGEVTLQPDGTVRYDPDGQFDALADGESGTDRFDYQISDGNGGFAWATVTVAIMGRDSSSEPTEGLLAKWTLDDGAGRIATDQSGNAYDGVLGGDPVWSDGFLDGALEFDRSGDHVDAGLGPSIVGTGGFTVAAWVRSQTSANQVIIQQRSTQEYNGQYQLHLTPAGQVRFWTFGGFAYGPTVISSQSIHDGSWHHVAGVREDDGTVKIYIDGMVDGSVAGTSRPLAPIRVYLGADMRGTTGFLGGALDDVRVYDRALDADEVDTLFYFAPASDPAVATDDTHDADEDSLLIVPPPGLLANDTGSSLSITGIDSHSALGMPVGGGSDGGFQYDPRGSLDVLGLGEVVTDTFHYTVSDGTGSDTGTVTVRVVGVNDHPVANDDNRTTEADAATTIDVLANDFDPDAGDEVAVASVQDDDTRGTVVVQVDGSISYDPAGQFDSLAAGETDQDVFGYTVIDAHGGTDSATVTITVVGVDSSLPPNPVPGLLAHWSLDDGAGQIATDQSGSGFDAALVGDPSWSSGRVDGGLQLDGIGDHLDAGPGPSITGSGGFTVAAWVRTTAASSQVIVQQRSSVEYNGEYQLHLTPEGQIRFWTFGGFRYGPIATSAQSVHDGQWHHVAGVREDDGTVKVYVDGTLDGSRSGSARPLVPIAVYVGADMRGGTSFFNGWLDEVRIYDRPLSSQEVQDLLFEDAEFLDELLTDSIP